MTDDLDLSAGLEPTPQPRRGRANYDDIISRHAKAEGVDENLVRAVIGQESGGNPRALSPKGASGLMQLMPQTAKRFGTRNINDPEENIRGGTRYLRFLNDRYKGDVDKVLAGYNAGEGAVDKFGGIPPYKETRNYVPSVKARYQQLTGQQPRRLASGVDISAGLESPQTSSSVDLSAGLESRPSNTQSSAQVKQFPQSPTANNRFAAMARVAQQPTRGVRGVVRATPAQLQVGGKVGGQASTGVADLRRIDEPETSRINRIQSEVTAAQTPAERQMRRAPGTANARLLDPKLTENEEVLRRVAAEQDDEKRAAAARAETQRLISQFTDAERREIAGFVNHLQGKGSIYTGARTGIRRAGSSALYKLAGLADIGNAVAKRTVGESWIPDYLRKKALAGELSVDDIPTERRNQIAEFLAETGVGLAELVAAPGTVTTKFAGMAGSEAIGRNRPAKEVIGETAKGAAMGQVQKYGEALAPVTKNYARRLATSAPAVGLGSGAVELATGATPREALMSTVTNAAFQGLGEAGRGRRARTSEIRPGVAAETATFEPKQGGQIDVPQIETKSGVTAQPEAVELPFGNRIPDGMEGGDALPRSAVRPEQPLDLRSGRLPDDTGAVRGADAIVGTAPSAGTATIPEVVPRRWLHADFGEVTEASSQARAGKGRVKVVAEDGLTHYVKKSDLSGRGNQRMIPLKPEPSVTEPVTPPPTISDAKIAELQSFIRAAQDPRELMTANEELLRQREIIDRAMRVPDLDWRERDRLSDEWVKLSNLRHQMAARQAELASEGMADNLRQAGAVARDIGYDVSDLVRGEAKPVEPVQVTPPKRRQLLSAPERRTPERIPQTDWLAMSDAERAQIRREVDLEQQNPVEPKLAQLDILSERSGEVLLPPLRARTTESVPKIAPPSTPESTTSARKSQLAQDRAELDLPELPPAERKSWQQSLDNAKPETALRLADEVNNKPRALSDEETASVVVRAQQVKNELKALRADIATDPTPEKIAQSEVLQREFNQLSTAAKLSGTEKGRALAAQKLTINQDYDLTDMTARMAEAKGRELTSKESKQVADLHERLVKAEAERDAANERAAQAELQKQIDKVTKRGTRRQQRTETKQSLDDEFVSLKAQLAQAKAEISGIQASGLAGLDPEGKLTKIIAKMARNRVKAGVADAAQLVDDVFAAVKDSVEGITKRDIQQAISGYGLEPRQDTRPPEAKQLAAIRTELRQLLKSEDIEAGRLSPRQEGPHRDYAKNQTRLKQLEKQEADLVSRMAVGDFEKPARQPVQYTRETYAKQKTVDDLKAQFEKMRYRATRSTGGKIADTAIGLANVPKTALSMGDLSALLRQGGVGFMQHPILSTRAAKDMFKSFSEHGFANVVQAIKNSPEFDLAKKSGVEFTGIDKDDPRLSRKEEGYLGSGAIDTLSQGRFNPLRAVKAVKDVSERTFVSFLDSQRMRIFEQQSNALRNMGLTGKDLDAALKSQAKYINIITGRGSLGESGNKYAPALNLAMFSPRLVASRFQLLNKMLNPVAWARMPKGARKLQMVDNAKFLVGTATVLGLAKAAGADVTLDPDDSEFLKIKIGNTRYDTLTGLQQPMRFMLRLAGAIEADATGDETYAGGDKGDIVAGFARSKASPELELAVDYLAGGNRLTGEKFKASKNIREAVTPLPIQDFMEAAKTDGKLRGIIETLPALLGVGAQTYKGAAEKPSTHAEKLARKFVRSKLPDEFREQETIDVDAKKSDLRARSRRGDDVSADLAALGGKLTEKQAKGILAARNKTRLQEDTNRLGIREALLVYFIATPSQREELKELLEKKAPLVDALPLEQQDAVRAKMKEFGMVPGMKPRPPREPREPRKPRQQQQGYVFP